MEWNFSSPSPSASDVTLTFSLNVWLPCLHRRASSVNSECQGQGLPAHL
jgi:hypothetical protein